MFPLYLNNHLTVLRHLLNRIFFTPNGDIAAISLLHHESYVFDNYVQVLKLCTCICIYLCVRSKKRKQITKTRKYGKNLYLRLFNTKKTCMYNISTEKSCVYKKFHKKTINAAKSQTKRFKVCTILNLITKSYVF